MQVKVKVTGLNSVLRAADRTYESFYPKINKVLDRLAEDGMKEAQSRFDSSVLKDKSGNIKKPYVVMETRKGNLSREIIANGTDAVYSEFGVGILNTYTHQLDSVIPGIDPLGHHITSDNPRLAWLYSQGRSLGDVVPWAIKHGSVPSEAMYKTAMKLERDIPSIINEVFK